MNKRHVSWGLQSGVSHSYTRRGWNRWGRSQSHIGFTQDFPCIPRDHSISIGNGMFIFTSQLWFSLEPFCPLISSYCPALGLHIISLGRLSVTRWSQSLLSFLSFAIIVAYWLFFLITRGVMLVSTVNLMRSRLTRDKPLDTGYNLG